MIRHYKVVWALLILFLSVGLAYAQFAGGSGTESDPWLIATPAQLNAIRNYLGQAHADKHFRLVADIDIGIDNWGSWTPIGNITPFYGFLDGDTHVVYNMSVAPISNGLVGFIGKASNAVIRNLSILNIATSVWDCPYSIEAGGLVVESNNCLIDNCHVSGSIYLQTYDNLVNSEISNSGGLIGLNGSLSTVSNCSASCNISAYGFPGVMSSGLVWTIGGMIGCNLGVVSNSYTAGGSVVAISDGMNTSETTGGLVGFNSGQIIECYSNIETTGQSIVGGLVGGNTGLLMRCCANSDVSAYWESGGLVGRNDGQISVESQMLV